MGLLADVPDLLGRRKRGYSFSRSVIFWGYIHFVNTLRIRCFKFKMICIRINPYFYDTGELWNSFFTLLLSMPFSLHFFFFRKNPGQYTTISYLSGFATWGFLSVYIPFILTIYLPVFICSP